jgi:hypothetical protein
LDDIKVEEIRKKWFQKIMEKSGKFEGKILEKMKRIIGYFN